MSSIPLSEAKDKLSALVEAAETTHEIVTITRHGREAAVLMAKADLDSLHETLFWLSQPDVGTDVDDARTEQREGRTATGEELRAEFGLAEWAHRSRSRSPQRQGGSSTSSRTRSPWRSSSSSPSCSPRTHSA